MYLTKSAMPTPFLSKSIIVPMSNPTYIPAMTNFLIGSYRQLPSAPRYMLGSLRRALSFSSSL